MQRLLWFIIVIAILLLVAIAAMLWQSGVLIPRPETPTPCPTGTATATPIPGSPTKTPGGLPTDIPEQTPAVVPTEGPAETRAPVTTPLPGAGLGGGLPGFPPGYPTPVGIPSRQTDWQNTCYTYTMPDSSPLGSSDYMGWESTTIERIEEYLAKAAACPVTLANGEVIPKPAYLGFNLVYATGHPNWDHWYYDYTPQWVYADIERRTGITLPTMGGRKTGYILDTDGDGPDPGVVCPMYDNPIWQEHMRESLKEIGKAFGDDPRLSAVMINTGIDTEVMGTKSGYRTGTNGTGQLTGVSGTTVTDTSQNWRTNDWRGWTLMIESGPATGHTLKVTSNTKDTLTLEGNWGTSPGPGDSYRLYKYCDYSGIFNQYVSAGGYNGYLRSMVDWHREFFPRKPVYLMSAWSRDDLADYCARKWPPVGTKLNAMKEDNNNHYSLTKDGKPGTQGVWLMLHNLYGVAPIAMESGPAHWEYGEYWAYLMALSVHSDWVDTYINWLDNEVVTSGFAAEHLGVSIYDTPSVWIALRETDYMPKPGGYGGKPGDFEFWLYRPERVIPYDAGNERPEDIPGNKTVVVEQADLPGGKLRLEDIPPQSWKARRTDQASDNRFMSFDIDDQYPFAGKVPFDSAGGLVGYDIIVTFVNNPKGERDTLSLQYLDYGGNMKTHVVEKGSHLGPLGQWVKYTWRVTDAYMNNGMPGRTDFRLSCNGDGDETIHMVQVKGFWGGEPPTLVPTNTPPPSPTPGPTKPPTATPTAGPGPTRTPFATPLPSPTPKPTGTLVPLVLDINPVRGPVIVDGSLNEWGGDRLMTLDVDSAYQFVGLIEGRADLSVDLWMAWDREFLYLAFHVNDNVLVADSDGALWHDDALEIGLDGLHDHKPWGSDDHQYTIRFDGALTDYGKVVENTGLIWATQRVTGGYEIELAIPWENMGYAEIIEGTTVGMNLGASNDDNGGSYDARLFWRGPSTQSSGEEYAALKVIGIPPTPMPTPTHTRTATLIPTVTGTPPTPTPTATPSNTPTPTLTFTPTLTPSATPEHGEASLQHDTTGYSGGMDTYISGWQAEANFDLDQNLIVRQGGIIETLIRFDLSGLPSPITVKDAMLYVYGLERSNENPMMVGIYPLNREWEAEEATWIMATADDAWLWEGAGSVPWDRAGESTVDLSLNQTYHWFGFDIGDLVQRWVDDPESNRGVILVGSGDVSVEYRLVSNERRSVVLHPRLEVEYVVGTPTPTPYYTRTATPTLTRTPTLTVAPSATPLPISGEYTFQRELEGYEGVADSNISGWDPDANDSHWSTLVVRQGGVIESLLRFDLQGLPQDSLVEKAVFGLYCTGRSNDNPMTVEVYAMNRSWKSQEATWLQASDEWLWHEPGASGAGSDRDVLPLATQVVTEVGARYMFDVTRAVRGWVEEPWTNTGFIVRGSGDVSVEYRFASSDYTSPSKRPWLYVYYRTLMPTPGPTRTPGPATPTPPRKPTEMPSPTMRPTNTPVTTPSPTTTPIVRPVGYQQGLAGYEGVTDTYINGWDAGQNYGQEGHFVVRTGEVMSALLRFDLASEEVGEEVVIAKLSLYARSRSNDNPMNVVIYEPQRDWVESEANWHNYWGQKKWAVAGAMGIGEDYAAAPVAETTLDSVGTWYHFDVTKAVQKWMADPSSNRGLLVRGYSPGNVSVEYRFDSSQSATLALRPKLTVFYALEPAQSIGLGPYVD